MRTWSGRYAPVPKHPDVTPNAVDIIIQLGRQHRFGGCGNSIEWSVLHHSALVSLLWLQAGYEASDLAYALLHDAHEAYTGDIVRPIKEAIGMDTVRTLEDHIDHRIRGLLKLPVPSPTVRYQIKVVDWVALMIETVLFGQPNMMSEIEVEMASFNPQLESDIRQLLAKYYAK